MGSQINEYSCAHHVTHGPKINFRDLPPNLTNDLTAFLFDFPVNTVRQVIKKNRQYVHLKKKKIRYVLSVLFCIILLAACQPAVS